MKDEVDSVRKAVEGTAAGLGVRRDRPEPAVHGGQGTLIDELVTRPAARTS